ncbi:flagellar hook-basal body complex protein FliE [Tatumella citrea]|uniref:Flagellar hook-basal body complex protein FliE n=1 Tax=Tatumella citrea TaxID=53336 RepID=A0A1Y0L919_TATCI|nr:flagellar hook-basal body complex protein FliE [Tatumella citrea]ARU94265.1 flagellar hook-basal body complex protein FliE [Tatumella citrea]ARU98305.1 flagellar hook-basal body complex protein FliE [Tatumella citrea]
MFSLITPVTEQMAAVADMAEGRKAPASQQDAFGSVFHSALNQLNQHVQQSVSTSEKFEAGDSDISLNDVMLNMQKASLSLQLGTQVRNKLVNAYTDIMNMSV